ncbi:MAG: DUF4160 domain-containing protein [Gemmatimonadota bacterium]
MYPNDHEPAHVHAIKGNGFVKIEIPKEGGSSCMVRRKLADVLARVTGRAHSMTAIVLQRMCAMACACMACSLKGEAGGGIL